MKKHKWTEEDDIVVFYLYKFGTRNISYVIEEISGILGMSTDSLKMRIENFRALDTGSGLSHYAKLSEKIYNEYKDYSETDLREIVIGILSNKTEGRNL